ncbi:MAG: long-chain fatty acid--CoA ligase [Candidatus Lernaella stagnicola]|nr:long-chain fatty acid--CoA ligase [Candidatus Lernaella stagnicola]
MNTLGNLLTRQAKKYGDKTFLYFENEQLSFATLEATANALAGGLLEQRCRHGEHIAFVLPNIPEWIITFFGIIKAGAVPLPINSLLKKEEIHFILQSSEARRLITIPQFADRIRDMQMDLPDLKEVYVLDDEAPRGMRLFEDLLVGPETPPDIQIEEADPACIIFTSGMTGRPKGATLSHRNYLTNAKQIVHGLEISDSDRILNILPLVHVNAQLVTLLAPLYAGAQMVLMRGFSARQFLPALDLFNATAFAGVPSVYAILNQLPDAEEYDLSHLRLCVCGAAPMPVDVFEQFEARFKAKIIEGYGLTEATCACSVNPIRGKRKIGSIGQPLHGVDMRIVDDDGNDVPAGEEGEIVVHGDLVMLGYFNDEEATAETLRDGWLHTGDIGYKDEDGFFFIRGRKKEMIIRGGENVYPREVEEVLIKHPAVGDVAVIGRPHAIWGEEVTAYIIPEGGEEPSRTTLMEYCRQHLADYKCPTSVVYVEQMPKTALMKTRRWALREE